jgi:hypothetical protein
MNTHIFRILILCFVLGGCASSDYDVHLYGVRYHDDAEVELSALEEAVTPLSLPGENLRALILPFAVRQEGGVRREIGRETANIFRRAWLEEMVFDVLEYSAAEPWPGLEKALALAKAKGADILVTGNVSHFFEGSGTGRTSVGITVEVYWVPESELIWSAAQAGVMDGGLDKDFVVVRTTRRLPQNPTYAVIRALAQSMGRAIASYRG